MHGGSGVSFGVIEVLRALRPAESLELVHRLDRDTSGCLLVARKAERAAHHCMRCCAKGASRSAILRSSGTLAARTQPYRCALAHGSAVGGERTVKAHASGKAALSDFRPLQFFGKRATLMEVALHTGRTHQIRVHAAHAGHALAGDEKYGDADFNRELKDLGLARMFLHAHSVGFEWPQGGAFSASAPLPQDLGAVLDRLAAHPPARVHGRT